MRRFLDQSPDRERRRQIRLMSLLERQFQRRFAKEFQAETIRVLTFYKITGEFSSLLFDHLEALTKIEADLVEISMRVFGDRILNQGKAAGLILDAKLNTTTFYRDKAIEYLRQESVRQRISSISKTTRERIISALTMAIRDGKSIDTAIDEILKASALISKTRAKIIARTELHGAANAGANEAAKEAALDLKKEWISANDDRTRPGHRKANGQVVEQDQKFKVTNENGVDEFLLYPGDPNASVGMVVNCRCTLGHVLA